MIVDTLFVKSSEPCMITAFRMEQKSVHFLRYELFDSYACYHGPEDEIQIDDSWMDNLDEAA